MTAFANQTQKLNLQTKLDSVLTASIDHTGDKATVPGVVYGVTNEKETVYLHADGLANLDGKPLEADAVFAFYSCTKAVTATAILILVDRGLVDLDAPASQYLPELKEIGVVQKVNSDGSVEVKSPKTQVTLKHLLTHTAGFGYPFFHEEYFKVHKNSGSLDIFNIQSDLYDGSHLLFEPGTQWTYGMNIDWAGKVLEAVSGKTLGQFSEENIFKPLGMTSSTFHLEDTSKLTQQFYRNPESGKFEVNKFQQQTDPVYDLGGSGLFSTVSDYLKFIRLWLNDGKTDAGVQLLKEETVKFALDNHLPSDLAVTSLPSLQKNITNPFVVPSDVAGDVWSIPFAISTNDLATGRPKGTHHWCGISNLFYWVDTKNKIGGFWAQQIFPFLDEALTHFAEAETVVYDALKK